MTSDENILWATPTFKINQYVDPVPKTLLHEKILVNNFFLYYYLMYVRKYYIGFVYFSMNVAQFDREVGRTTNRAKHDSDTWLIYYYVTTAYWSERRCADGVETAVGHYF